jgi:Ca2+-binding RTX toxin-like protein
MSQSASGHDVTPLTAAERTARAARLSPLERQVLLEHGTDALMGELGIDLLVGDLGADTLIGGDGADLLFAGVLSAPPGIGWPMMMPPPPFGGSTFYSDLLLAWSSAPNTPDAAATVRALATPAVSDDVVTGGFSSDWFWTTETTDTLDRKTSELLN